MNHHKPILLFIITYFLADDSIGAKLSNIKKISFFYEHRHRSSHLQ